jgi:Uma2 family endonuclease
MSAIVIAEQVRLPNGIKDLSTFRRWARSDQYPESGWFSYLGGDVWVDLSMERVTHNQIKSSINVVLAVLARTSIPGLFFPDRMMLVNADADLSTEPDGMFVATKSLRAKRVRLEEGGDSSEVVGSPDMVLEVLSKSSVEKDTVLLKNLYLAAEISEYWLVDSREAEPEIEILRRIGAKYVATRKRDSWVKSSVFGKDFRLERTEVDDNVFTFTLLVR